LLFINKRNSPKNDVTLGYKFITFPHPQASKQFKNMVYILELFGLATNFWLLFQKIGRNFSIFWSPCFHPSLIVVGKAL
jgi:hypothetical protein